MPRCHEAEVCLRKERAEESPATTQLGKALWKRVCGYPPSPRPHCGGDDALRAAGSPDIYLFISLLSLWAPASSGPHGVNRRRCFLCLHSTSISTAPITFLPHPLIL